MKIKRLLGTLLTITLLGTGVLGCGTKETKSDNKKVTIGVVGSIYDELWASAKEKLKKEGIDLEIQQFSDYATPNSALDNGEIDLNAFQHEIYLENEVKTNNYKIQAIGYTFIIPLNLYSNKVKSVEEIKDGDSVAIPNDVTNGGRALKVLEAAKLIKLKDDSDFSPTVDDIEKYNVKINIKQLSANTIPSALDDVTAAVVNGNYALDFGLKTNDAIFKDTSLDQKQYWNLIAARTSDLKDKSKVKLYKKVIKAFQTSETEKVFNDKYDGYFISVGWDEDLLK